MSSAETTARQVVLLTGASSGFGNAAAHALASAGHVVYAGMRAVADRNADVAKEMSERSSQDGIALHPVEMDVQDQGSVDGAVAHALDEQGRLDVVVHNAGHMVLGPAEAFTVEQVADAYDVNVLSTQRVNRAVLPIMRRRRSGHLVWVASSSTRGGHPPFLGPYFAAKAAMDALAEVYAAELIRYGIDTSIIVPGAYPTGTNHFAHASTPADEDRAAEYDAMYGELRDRLTPELTRIFPEGHGVAEVAAAVVRAVAAPPGHRPFRVHVDPSHDGSEVVSAVFDRIRAEFYRRVGIAELLPAEPSL